MSETSRRPVSGLTVESERFRPPALSLVATGNEHLPASAPPSPPAAWTPPTDHAGQSDPGLTGPVLDDGPSRARLAMLTAAASFAIVLLIAAAVAAVRQWNAPPDARAVTAVTTAGQAGGGERIQASHFSFVQPANWQDRSGEVNLPTRPGVVSERILSGPRSTAFPANILINRAQVPDRPRSLDVLRQDFLVGLRNRTRTAEPIGAPIYLQVAGADATSFEFRYRQDNVDVAGRAVIISHEGNVYLVLFQTGEVDYDLHVNALWELLESWRWR